MQYATRCPWFLNPTTNIETAAQGGSLLFGQHIVHSDRQYLGSMDGLDELLDEAEGLFGDDTEAAATKSPSSQTKPNVISPTPETQKSSSSSSKHVAKQPDAEMDSLLAELSSLADTPSSLSSSRPSTSTQKIDRAQSPAQRSRTSSQPTKCRQLILAGTSVPRRIGLTQSPGVCSTLRCTDCDHIVCCFDDYVWSDASDYLFFRNNCPDFDKLKVNLIPKKGFRAFACQCQWASYEDVTPIVFGCPRKWVCGKH
eukprot:m.88513 g.88513  ORF g.88513 m.88513 type:complete len:255 (+) comp12864_c0_seq2:92-856(+)